MRKRYFSGQMIFLLATIIALTGCDGKESEQTSDHTNSGPVFGGALTYATDREPLCLDPHTLGDIPQVLISQQFLDSLVSMDNEGHIRPWLAKSWDISPDGLVYVFHLRGDVYFTDGTRFDAAALKANLDHMVDPKTQSSTASNYLRQYQSTEIVDKYTAAVHLSRPYTAFLEVLAQGFLGIESPTAIKRTREENCAAPVGSGPFKVVRWDRQSQVVLERNQNYAWAPPTALHQGPAYLDRIIWKFIPDPVVRFASLQSGEVDVIDSLPPEAHGPARQNPDITLLLRDRPGNPTHGAFNTTREPFNDLRVREAFIRSANVDGALKSVFFGEFTRASGSLNPATPFYSADFEGTQNYDPTRANQLLDEAGWDKRNGDGYRIKGSQKLVVKIPLGTFLSNADRALWEQIQASTKQVGFAVDLEPMSTAEMIKCCYSGWDYDVRIGYWNTNTADVLRYLFSSSFLKVASIFRPNSTGFNQPEFDKIVSQALEAQDEVARRGLYYKAQAIIAQNYLQLSLYPQSTRLAIYKTARDVRIESSLSISYLYDAWIKK
ncbi:ABC transporter substrate-binding protein [Pseudomonas typographi]|uniref:ABC transporter substrate-binding protein n=1 Tax=Pseudomonas typographi TaxID=2715964 RepID=A0ABR7YY31_9PSED|nr:ABC transporter substrate-binding protein [Pseudomonas typographi]MBD1598123.1 ABC transporter substrate-binding protein [Pseudomonas typographi]